MVADRHIGVFSVGTGCAIARRLQDSLAELAKIDPKSIGVGQYQHDVDQNALVQSLDGVVENFVNVVSIDVNTASPVLLARIAGLHATLVVNIVAFRDENGTLSSPERCSRCHALV